MNAQEVNAMRIPTILSIDLGSTIGLALYENDEYTISEDKFTDLPGLLDRVRKVIVEHSPGLIIIPYPTSFYNTIVKHAKQMGIVCLLGEYHSITVIEVNDSHAKKVVFQTDKLPKGQKKISKQMIKDHYLTQLEHAADAMLFLDCYLIEEYKVRFTNPNTCILS